jgi:hypothetical protein
MTQLEVKNSFSQRQQQQYQTHTEVSLCSSSQLSREKIAENRLKVKNKKNKMKQNKA